MSVRIAPPKKDVRPPQKTSGPSFSVYVCAILNSDLVSLRSSQQGRRDVLQLRVSSGRGRRLRAGMVMVPRAAATKVAALQALDDKHGQDRCDGAHERSVQRSKSTSEASGLFQVNLEGARGPEKWPSGSNSSDPMPPVEKPSMGCGSGRRAPPPPRRAIFFLMSSEISARQPRSRSTRCWT